MTRLRHLAGLLPALLAAACARPAEPPLLSLGDRACDTRPVLEGANPVPPDSRTGVRAKLGAAGRCLRPQGAEAATTYAVFALPPASAPMTLNIISFAAKTLVLPRATLLDASGAPVRVLAPEEFRDHVAGLMAGVRLRGTERWLVVEADRARLGQPVELRLGDGGDGRVLVAATTFIYIPPPPIPDVLRENKATYALNGTVRAAVIPVPTVP